MSLWLRVRRLIEQSRIRLPARPVRADELGRGDWVQVGSERYQVRARRRETDRVVFRLRSVDASPDATLTASRRTEKDWTLEVDGREVSVPPELLVVFSVM